MYIRINFSRSNVLYYERDTYLERLITLARSSLYQRAMAYRDEDSPDWVIIVKSEYPGFPCKEKEFIQVFRELKRRGCDFEIYHISGYQKFNDEEA